MVFLFFLVDAALALVLAGVGMASPSPAAPGPAAPGPEAPEPALSARLAEASTLGLDGPPQNAAGFRLDVGGVTLSLDAGWLARVRDGLGPVGLVLDGRGRVGFEERDPAGRLIFGWNLSHATKLRLHGGRMECRLKKALLLWPGGLPAEVLSGHAGTPAPDDDAGEAPRPLAVLTDVLERWTRTRDWDFPVRRLLAQEEKTAGELTGFLEGAETFVVRAGADGSLRLSSVDFAEDIPALETLRIRRGTGPRRGWTLSQARLDLAVGAPPAIGILARLRLDPPQPGGAGTGREDRASSSRALVAFALTEAREIRQAEMIDPSRGFAAEVVARTVPPAVRVRQVRDAAGHSLEFVHAHETLLVRMPEARAAADVAGTGGGADPAAGAETAARGAVEIVVELDTDLGRHPAGHDYFTLRTPGWFPVPEGQDARFGLSWSIRSPDPLRPVTGSGAERRDGGEAGWLLEQSFPLPVRLPLAACGKYVLAEAKAGDTPVRAWSYARPNPQGDAIARFSAAALSFYQGIFGAYRFPVLDIVETAPRTGGQSGPGILLIEGKDEAQLARDRRNAGALEFNMTFAHEVAHQWWGQSVSWKSGRDEWLFEALADYSGWLFVRTLKGDLGEAARRQWLARARGAASAAPIAEADGLGDDLVSRETRANLIYGKGALLLHRLARETGEDAFVAALGAFARANAGRDVDGAAFIASVSASTGKDLRPLFDEWVNGTGLPKGTGDD